MTASALEPEDQDGSLGPHVLGPIGVIVGLKAEAAVLTGNRTFDPSEAKQKNQGQEPFIAIAGGSAERAERLAHDLAARGAKALLSFGIGGGLDPRLTAGTVIVAEGVFLPDGHKLLCDPKWRKSVLCRQGLPVALCEDMIVGSDQPLATVEEKRRLCEQTGAVLVDMESHGVAKAAQALSLPFLAIRAVADSAHRALPPSALVGMDGQGNTKPLAVLGALLKRPQDLSGLIGLAKESQKAMAALKTLARLPLS